MTAAQEHGVSTVAEIIVWRKLRKTFFSAD
jgi:hypothetical protein